MDDDDCGYALNVANLENKGSSVGSQEHGETISHVPGPDGVVMGVKDVRLSEAVLQRRSGNDRIVHRSKVTCDVLFSRGVWSWGGAGGCCGNARPVSVRVPLPYPCCVLFRSSVPGERAGAADVLAEIGVERGAHACWAAGLVNAATSAQGYRFCWLVSRLATIRGPYGIGRLSC